MPGASLSTVAVHHVAGAGAHDQHHRRILGDARAGNAGVGVDDRGGNGRAGIEPEQFRGASVSWPARWPGASSVPGIFLRHHIAPSPDAPRRKTPAMDIRSWRSTSPCIPPGRSSGRCPAGCSAGTGRRSVARQTSRRLRSRPRPRRRLQARGRGFRALWGRTIPARSSRRNGRARVRCARGRSG